MCVLGVPEVSPPPQPSWPGCSLRDTGFQTLAPERMLTRSSEGVLTGRVREVEALPALPATPMGGPSWPGLHVRPTHPASDVGDLRVPQAVGSPSQL